jgi:hypothetical protein
MAGTVTLSTLRTRIRRRCDQEHTGSTFVSDTELTDMVNVSYAQMYGHLVRSGLHMAESVQSITADSRTTSYDLNADLYAVLGVFLNVNGERTRLTRHDVRVRPSSTSLSQYASTYRVSGADITFNPWPTSGTYEVVYVPLCSTLSADGDTMDGVLGWEEYVVLDCAVKILDKEESDSRPLRAERAEILERLKDEAAAVEMTETWVVATSRADAGSVDPSSEYHRQGYRGGISSWRRG